MASESGDRPYLRLLVVLSSPHGPEQVRLNVDLEWGRLIDAITSAADPIYGLRAAWAIELLSPQGRNILGFKLSAARYDVVHIGCHFEKDRLILENELGDRLEILATDLKAQFAGSGVQVVVLNGCNSDEVGQVLAEVVPCVIATRKPLLDSEAQLFCSVFYRGLASGYSVERARIGVCQHPALGANIIPIGSENWRPEIQTPGGRLDSLIIPHPPRNGKFRVDLIKGFIGRRDELQSLARWLKDDKKVLALHGPGGSGKTAFALYAATRFAHSFQAVVYVSAQDQPGFGPAQVLDALRDALKIGAAPEEERDIPGAIARRLKDGKILLILDNIESIPAESTQAKELGEALHRHDSSHGSRVIVTTRFRSPTPLLGPANAHEFLEVSTLPHEQAVRLLAQTWRACAPFGQHPPTIPEPRDKRELERLDRLRPHLDPTLGLKEIAAFDLLSRLAFDHPDLLKRAAELVASSSFSSTVERFEALTKGLSAEPPEEPIRQAMEALFGQMVTWLRDRAPVAVQVLHAVLPFVEGALEEDLYYVTFGRKPKQDKLVQFHDTMLKKAKESSLLAHRRGGFELDPPVRAYLEERLKRQPDGAQELSKLRLRHAEAFLNNVRDGAREQQTRDWANVGAALDWLAGQVPQQEGTATDGEPAQLLVDYAMCWREVLINGEALRRLDWLLAARWAARRIQDSDAEVLILEALGDVYRFRRELQSALHHYRQALDRHQLAESHSGMAYILRALSSLAVSHPGTIAGRRAGDSFTEILTEMKGTLRGGRVLQALGDIYRTHDELAEARRYYEEALGIYEKLETPIDVATVLRSLGDVTRASIYLDSATPGNSEVLAQAVAYYRRVVLLFRNLGEVRSAAQALETLGALHRSCNQLPDAERCYAEALAGYQSSGALLERANVLLALGDLSRTEADPDSSKLDAALDYYQQVLSIYQQLKAHLTEAHLPQVQIIQGEARVWESLGHLHLLRDEEQAASECFHRADEVARTSPSKLEGTSDGR